MIQEKEYLDKLSSGEYRDDPLAYVQDVFEDPQAPGCSVEPDQWQRDVLKALVDSSQIAVASGHGIGKALADKELIPTPEGLVPHGGLEPGDFVFGSDGRPIEVLAVTRWKRADMYRLEFGDGQLIEASGGHLWKVRRNDSLEWELKTTLELYRDGGDWYLPRAPTNMYGQKVIDPVTWGRNVRHLGHSGLPHAATMIEETDRLRFIEGLFGTNDLEGATFRSSHRQLVRDVTQAARAAGFTAKIGRKSKSVTITFDRENQHLVGIRMIRSQDCSCITVDSPDGMYVGPGYKMTHNSAMMAWIIHWFTATRDHPQIVVTANTSSQLSGKTWRELKKWNDRAINGHHFRWSKTKFEHLGDPDTWFAQAVPWSEHNSEAFAGTHEQTGVLICYDEASAIADVIWEVTAGAMTTEGALWVCFGNPTKNTGRFRNCFKGGKEEHRWKTFKVDSRTARMTDKSRLEEWIEDYGEDSDFVRVRVRGEFPRASTEQFIPIDFVDDAMSRTLDVREYYQSPKILGVDVAKGGDAGDRNVIIRRQGKRAWAPRTIAGVDTMGLVAEVVDEYNTWHPTAICVDGTGVGTGVVSRLRELNYPVIDVMVGAGANDPIQYYNLRTELWGLLREWLRQGGMLEPCSDLRDELISPEYDHTAKMQIRLEPKKYTKKRLGASPDLADSLILTFAAEQQASHVPTVLPVRAAPSHGWWTY